jgi:hypothetical protein
MAWATNAVSRSGLVAVADAGVGTVNGAVMGEETTRSGRGSAPGNIRAHVALLHSIKIIAQAPILGNNIEFH